MGIKVLPPDVNESESNFAAQGDDVILFGLSAVRNVGTNVVESIIKCRKSKGKYSSFPDFLDKVEVVVCNKRTVESLIKAGAFDTMGHTRKSLVAHHEPMIDNVVAVKRKEAEGQFDLFGGMGGDEGSGEPGFGMDVVFSDDEWEKSYLLAQEREMLGLYVSDHPLFGIEHVLTDKADASIAQLADLSDGSIVTIGGIISGLQRKMTKQGNAWAIATVEDLAGSIDCMFFPASYQLVSTQLVEDAVVFVKGRLDKREDVPRLVAMELMVPDLSDAGTNAPVVITIPALKVTPPMVGRLGEILSHHKGNTEVRIKLQGPRKTTVLRLDRHRVQPDPALYGDLKAARALLPGRLTARPCHRTAPVRCGGPRGSPRLRRPGHGHRGSGAPVATAAREGRLRRHGGRGEAQLPVAVGGAGAVSRHGGRGGRSSPSRGQGRGAVSRRGRRGRCCLPARSRGRGAPVVTGAPLPYRPRQLWPNLFWRPFCATSAGVTCAARCSIDVSRACCVSRSDCRCGWVRSLFLFLAMGVPPVDEWGPGPRPASHTPMSCAFWIIADRSGARPPTAGATGPVVRRRPSAYGEAPRRRSRSGR